MLEECLRKAWPPGAPRRYMTQLASETQARLEAQLAFLTDRYDRHCPWWQYPIWARQFALELTAVLPDLFEPDSDAHEATTWAHAGVAVLVLVASLAWPDMGEECIVEVDKAVREAGASPLPLGASDGCLLTADRSSPWGS